MPCTSAAPVLLSKHGGLWLPYRTQTQRFTFFQGSAFPNPAGYDFVITGISTDFPHSPSTTASVMLSTTIVLIMEQCFALDLFNEGTMAARKVHGGTLCGCKSQQLDPLGLTPVGLKHFTPTGDLSLSSFPGNTAGARAGGGAEPPEHTALTSLNMVISKPIIFPLWLTCDISETFSKASDFWKWWVFWIFGTHLCSHPHKHWLDNMMCLLQTMGNLKIKENNLFQEAIYNIICYIKSIMHYIIHNIILYYLYAFI